MLRVGGGFALVVADGGLESILNQNIHLCILHILHRVQCQSQVAETEQRKYCIVLYCNVARDCSSGGAVRECEVKIFQSGTRGCKLLAQILLGFYLDQSLRSCQSAINYLLGKCIMMNSSDCAAQ